ncbi:MAG: protoporphyrinogen oxidase [Prolixibacteraceae bacterium]|nr:protoporphyrinogen oxidase [Prolixibacteraceae bacterium]MBN2649572.1 protoporphyrinogen oxidase [Prolixibacteraceae bacterium]
MHKDIVIIGAGLTGLATAHYLKKAGFSVAVIEKENRTGGVINSHHEAGFLFESGPNTGVISWPEVAELFEELHPECKLVTANPEAKRRLIWKGKKWHAIPSGPISAITTPLYTIKDKFRILGEPWRKPGTSPMENLSDFVKRRLGKSFLDYTVDPFVSGVYAGKTDYLVPKYALPKLYNLEQQYGSFIKGSIAKAKEKKNNPRLQKATKEVFSAEEGLKSLTNALVNSVGNENIFTSCNNTSINPKGKKYLTKTNCNGETIEIESKYVVSTVGAYALPGLLPFIGKEALIPIINLQYAKIVQVILGYNKWAGCDIKAFGGLVPSIEKRNILGVLFTSSFFEGRAPEGGALLSVFMGGTRMPEQYNMSNDEIIGILQKEIPHMMKLDSFNPDMIRIFRYQHAIAQYGADSKERFETIEKLEQKYPGLILAGSMRNGIGMADRIKQACTIADSIIRMRN